MATEKILNTRVILKHDTLENWNKASSITLKEGEVALAKVEVNKQDPISGELVRVPTYLIKVGDGLSKFGSLNWVAAPAADVHDWAKAATKPTYNASEIEGLADFIGDEIQDTDLDTRYSFEIPTSGDNKGKLVVKSTLYTKGTAGAEVESAVLDFITPDELSDTLSNYKTKQEAKLYDDGSTVKTVTKVEQDENGVVTVTYNDIAFPTDHDTQTEVTAGEGITVTPTISDESRSYEVAHTVPTNVAKNVTAADRTYVKSLTFDKFGHVTAVDVGAETVENTAHTHSAGDGLKLIGNGGVSGDTKYELNLEFAELGTDNILKLVDQQSKAVIAQFDASDFVKDSFLKEVTYSDTNKDNILTFVFELNDGTTTDVDVDLSHLVDVYTADETTIHLTSDTNGNKFSIKDGGVDTDQIAANAVTAAKLNDDVDTYVDGRIDSKIQALDVDDITGFGAGKTLATLTETDGKIAATFQDISITESQISDFGDYKTKQTAVVSPTANGKALSFIDTISQNANGEITATKKEVDLGNYALKNELPTVNNGKLSIATEENVLTGSGDFTANQAGDTTITIAIANKGIGTAKIADKAIGSAQINDHAVAAHHLKACNDYTGDDAEVWVFDCGTSGVTA